MYNQLSNWMWKWHFIGGAISLPFVFLIAITGIIYLFKDNYEKPSKEQITTLTPEGSQLRLEEQWHIAKNNWKKSPDAVIYNNDPKLATEFTSGQFSHKSSFFLNPYSGKETGQYIPVNTDMHKVRKLHGELLLGSYGTKVIELVASWLVVLILSGIYIYWPKGRGLKGLILIRTNLGKRIFYRDLHGILGFWFSGLLLIILAGGFPWTDVFGSNYKWLQNETNSGLPKTWSPHTTKSMPIGNSLTLDYFHTKASELELDGIVSIGLPKSSEGVFSISNQTTEFKKMKMYHFDRYSGDVLRSHSWEDIGIMMKIRLWVMAFHQGEFGTWNFILVITTAIALCFMCVSAFISYIKRKPKNTLGIPKSSNTSNSITRIAIVVLGLLFPLFGLSVLILFAYEMITKFLPRIRKI